MEEENRVYKDSREARYPRHTVFCVCVSSLSGFSTGWTIGSPNVPGEVTHSCPKGYAHAAVPLLPDCLIMDSLQWGVAVSSFCVGGLIASLLAGKIITLAGRKWTITINNFGWIFGSIYIAFAINPAMFIAGRFIMGLSCGIGAVATTAYNGEVSTIKGRGAMGASYQLFTVLGILLSNVVGVPLAEVPLWRINYGLVAIPALLQIFLMIQCVESPRYLLSIDEVNLARQALQRLRGRSYQVESELHDIILEQRATDAGESICKEIQYDDAATSYSKSENSPAVVASRTITTESYSKEAYGIIDLFKNPVVRCMTLTVILLHAAQELSAINGVIYYSTIIFRQSFDPATSITMTIIGSVINCAATLLSVFLIEKLGRRFLLLLSQGGGFLSACLLIVGGYLQIQPLLVASVYLFVFLFAIGLGPIPWLITSELSPSYATSSMTAVAISINWGSNFFVALVFPKMMEQMHSFAFMVFAVILLVSTFLTYVFVPETKGKTADEIYAIFVRRAHRSNEANIQP